jgi:hypothetical protein
MSSAAHASDIIVKPEALRSEKLPLLQTVLGIVFLVCAAISAAGFFMARDQWAFSWLWGVFFAFTICSGCFFWPLVHFATDAAWSTVIRRQWENVNVQLMWLPVLFLPFLIPGVRESLWSWMNPEMTDPNHPLLYAKKWYLTTDKMLVRDIIILALFALWTFMMRKCSVAQDYDGDPKWTHRLRNFSYFGLPVFGVGYSLLVIDMLMALDFKWFSTMWGVYLFAGAAWSAMAVAIITITLLKNSGHLKETVSEEHYHTMGKLLFAFTVFWSYIAFDQYMLIWYANIPEETSYFIRRNVGGWHILSTMLFLGHFVVPFLLLLPRNIPIIPFMSKKNPKYLLCVGIYVLVIQALDLYIIIMPVRPHAGEGPQLQWIWLDVACLGAIVSAVILGYLRTASKAALIPARDPRIVESIHLAN